MSFIEEANSLKRKIGVGKPNLFIAVGLVLIVGALAVFLCGQAWGWFNQPGISITQESSEGEESSDESTGSSSSAKGKTVFVHVAGCVAAPGLYELPVGSRVSAAIDAAGGFSDDAVTESVNLARELTDGEQILVSSSVATEGQGQDGTGISSSSGYSNGKVNINLASAEELTSLNGIGDATAAKIIAYRDQNGSFSSIEEIKEVSGIGDKKFENIKDSITV